MRLSEIVFQGIFGASNPSRLKIEPEFHHLRLPRLVEPRAFQTMIASLLYPDAIDANALSADVQATGTFRIGAVLEVDRRRYKVFRQNDAESIVLQDVTSGANEVARGAAAVSRSLRKLLYLPPLEDFRAFHMWALPDVVEGSGGGGGATPRNSEQKRLVELYQSALKIEAADLKIENCRVAIKDTEREREEVGRPLLVLRRLEEHVESMSAVRDLTPEELAQIQNYKKTQADLSQKVQTLEAELEQVALAANAAEGDGGGPNLIPIIAATVVLAVTVYIVSGILDMRLIALVNILILGGTTFLIIRHFDQLQGSRKDQLHLDSVNRRLVAAEQERKDHRESSSALLDRLEVNSYMAFEQLMQAYEEDTARLEQMKADGAGSEVEAQVQALDAKIADLESDLAAFQETRAKLGDYTMPSYELERALEDEGLDFRLFKPQQEQTSSIPMPKNPTGTWVDAFPAMVELARARGVVGDAGLKPNTQQVWEKLAVLLLGRTWRGLGLQSNGEFKAPPKLRQGLVAWAKRKPDMAQLLVQTFAAAVAMGTDKQHAHGRCGIFVLSAPIENLDDERSSRLDRVFKSMGSRAEVVVLSN